MRRQNNTDKKERTGRPSGQASRQPERNGDAPSCLHQGQGPDFQIQDPVVRQHNKGVQEMEKEKPNTKRTAKHQTVRQPQERHEEQLNQDQEEKAYMRGNPE